MDKWPIYLWFKDWIAGLSYKILLWSLSMTEQQYLRKLVDNVVSNPEFKKRESKALEGSSKFIGDKKK